MSQLSAELAWRSLLCSARLFRFFADANETASTRSRTGASTGPSIDDSSIDGRWQQETAPNPDGTVAIENVQSDDEPRAVV